MKHFTTREVKEMLGISRSSMEGLMSRNEIGYIRIGGRRYITKEQYNEYIKSIENVMVEKPAGDVALETGLVSRVNKVLIGLGKKTMSPRECDLIAALESALVE
jgi:excisionase family DNA binding protein